jgi:hypothetical protein
MSTFELKTVLSSAGIDASSLAPLIQVDGAALLRLTMPGTEAIDTWRALHQLVDSSGHWPLILGDEDSLDVVTDNFEFHADETVASILERAEHFDSYRWRDERIEGNPDEIEEPHGPWPEVQPAPQEFTLALDVLSSQPLPKVVLGLIPTTRCWEVPAFLKYGGWNDCPYAYEHVALMRTWWEQYGAQPVGMSSDVIEMLVPRGPADRDAALELARAMYVYCPDIVLQGTQTLEALAASLMNSDVWYFWWD